MLCLSIKILDYHFFKIIENIPRHPTQGFLNVLKHNVLVF